MLATASPRAVRARSVGFNVRSRCVRDRPQLAAGVLRVCHLCFCRVAGVAVGAGRRRAALPRHHAEPAARWRSEDREQPPPRRLPGVLRRRAGAALHPPRRATARSTRSMRPACRRSSRRRLPSAATAAVVLLLLVDRGVRQRARVAPGVAGDGTGRRRLVRLGRGHACGDDHLSQLHGLSRRPWRRDRADRRVGAAARGRGAADGRRAACCRGSSTARRWRCCRGCTAGSRCSRAASARSCCCACRRRRTRRGRRWRFSRCRRSARSCWMASFVPSMASRILRRRTARSREFSLAFIPGGLAGLLFDQRFGLIRQCPGAPRRPRRSGDDAARGACAGRGGLERPGRSPPRARAALRHGSVPADRDELRHVVGGLERPGAICQPGGADSRDSLRRRLERASATAVREPSRRARSP